MVESNKILTVSYGTFSCTLEGFEDSFGTMKAIAEYFRDLAADDRYFGAEPPTPDAQMLAKIAEREITRRVEARTEDGEIVLRAEAPLAPAMPPKAQHPEPIVAATTMVAPQVAEANNAPQTAPPVPTLDETVTPNTSVLTFDDMAPVATATTPDSESVAAKLARIRAVVGRVEDENDNTSFVQDAENAPMPIVADDIAQEIPVTTHDNMPVESGLASSSDVKEDIAKAQTSDIAEALEQDEAAASDDTHTPIATDDVAHDTSETDASAADEMHIAQTEIADVIATESLDTADSVDIIQEDDITEAGDTVIETQEYDAEELDEGAENAAMMAILQHVSEQNDTTKTPDTIEPIKVDEIAAETGAPETTDDSENTDALLARLQDMAAAVKTADEEETSDATPATPAKPARIIRVKSGGEVIVEPKQQDTATQPKPEPYAPDDEAMEEQETLVADDEHDDDMTTGLSDAGEELLEFEGDYESSLSEADEIDLQNELADLETEYHAQNDLSAVADVDDALETDAETIVDETPAAKRQPQTLPEADDTVMSSLMTEADEQLNEPEGSRRRNAIAQLKAAVAATEAARQLGEEKVTSQEVESPFRLDLAEKTAEEAPARPGRPGRPARPTTAETADRPTRPDRSKIAPLKLVASQRIDTPEQQPAPVSDAPIAPRRVATAVVSPADVDSFAAFAKEMGASELPDLLEAAAAYTAFVEGEEDFSRPQIMKKVQLTTEETITREDGLRHFGALLREGRISKVRGGRFQVAEDSRFNPDVKSA